MNRALGSSMRRFSPVVKTKPKECIRCFGHRLHVDTVLGDFECLCKNKDCQHRWRERG
jgi:hypothetical protein